MHPEKNQIEEQLKQVRSIVVDCLCDTKISGFIEANKDLFCNGKMLRARLTLVLGGANGIDRETLVRAAAAVEIIHGASLLHDDVIDGGVLRRGAPAFWKRHGTNGAILLGDLLVFKGLQLVAETQRADLLEELISMATNVCSSEVEQELVLRGAPGTWEECEQIARAKTGSLFAFAAVAAAATEADGQADAFRTAGFILGTAYQLADDVLDASGNEAVSGKTLGTDRKRGKTTAITAIRNAPTQPADYIYSLLETSSAQLADWPTSRCVWDYYLNDVLKPLLNDYFCSTTPITKRGTGFG